MAEAPPTALEDASLSTWIHPTDGSRVPLLSRRARSPGFMLDIMIRDASDNRQSLDDVMRELYRVDLQEGPRLHRRRLVARGVEGGGRAELRPTSPASTWTAASRTPGTQVLPLAGLRMVAATRSASRGSASPRRQDSAGRVVVRRGAARRRRRGGRRQGRRRPARRWATSRSTIPTSAPSSGSASGRKTASRCRSRCGAMASVMTLNGKVRLVAAGRRAGWRSTRRRRRRRCACGRASSKGRRAT